MKEIILRIKISEKNQKIGFAVEKNSPKELSDTLELIGALNLIKHAYLNELGVKGNGLQ